jgi:hypothetical protein
MRPYTHYIDTIAYVPYPFMIVTHCPTLECRFNRNFPSISTARYREDPVIRERRHRAQCEILQKEHDRQHQLLSLYVSQDLWPGIPRPDLACSSTTTVPVVGVVVGNHALPLLRAFEDFVRFLQIHAAVNSVLHRTVSKTFTEEHC